jgi:integrase
MKDQMASGKGLNEAAVKALPIPAKGNKVHFFAGAVVQGAKVPRGFGVRVTAKGVRAFVLDYRIRQRQYRYTIGTWPDWSALKAVHEARKLRQRVDRGENPLDDRAPPAVVKTVAEVLDEFLVRHVRNKDRPLRSAKEYDSAFNRLVKPEIGSIALYELKRSQVSAMLDKIEDKSGPTMADRTLAYLRKAFNWQAARDDEFLPPIAKGMNRTKPKERARTRVLSDDELCDIWPHLSGTFGALVKMLLLTAQRRDEVAKMRWSEIDQNGVWEIPAERYKTKRSNVVPLSPAARAVVAAQARICDYVFAGRTGKTPFSGFSKAKAALDAAIAQARAKKDTAIDEKPKAMPAWTLHDLRRTAKTSMMRAGVRPDISERVLGHVIAGVEGVYDRHSYLDEKRDALKKLAAIVERIVYSAPSEPEVISLENRRQEARA